jgi:hypothetical protein
MARSLTNVAAAIAAIAAVATAALLAEGRIWWCVCGRPTPWAGAWDSHTSQHLFDPYSFTHVLHGVVFFWLLAWLAPRVRGDWRLVLAIGIEAAWEIAENSPFVIDRYRTATAALGYTGDTIANSMCDVLSCGLGYALARKVGARASAAVFVLVEVALLLTIRDSLLLNVVMLLFPVDAIRQWQIGR